MILLSSRVMLCALMAQWGGCYIQLDIQPKTIHLDSSHRVTIRCSLNLTRSRTEKVYSIMLKKGGSPVALLFQDRIDHKTNRHYDVTGSVTTNSSSVPFLQILLDNVTCLDRGDYSCIMAVKRLDKATTMGPVTSRLEIQGKPSDISVSLTPDTSTYTEGDVVSITCYRFWTSQTAYWAWTLPDGSEDTVLNRCTYNESECIYLCISSTQYTVTIHDSGSQVRCQSGELMKIIRLHLSTTSEGNGLSVNTTTTVPPTHITASSGDSTTPEREVRGVLAVYVLVSAFAVVLIVTLLCLLFSDPKCKCHHRTFKNSHAPRDTFRSERHRRRRRVMIVQSRNLTCPHPGLDRAGDEIGHRDGYLHPPDTADNSVSQSNEHVYEEID